MRENRDFACQCLGPIRTGALLAVTVPRDQLEEVKTRKRGDFEPGPGGEQSVEVASEPAGRAPGVMALWLPPAARPRFKFRLMGGSLSGSCPF